MSTRTKDQLIGMKVFDGEGNYLGDIKDLALSLGEGNTTLMVGKTGKDKSGDTQIFWNRVQAIGEIVILKRNEPPPQPKTQPCPSCGAPMRYIEQYKRWFCDKEQRYQ